MKERSCRVDHGIHSFFSVECFIPADIDITLEAVKLKAAHPVAYADCFAAALGMRNKAKVVTGDPEFKKFGDKVP